jgi:hypothetical protein
MLPWMTSWIDRPTAARSQVNGLGDLDLSARVVLFQERSFAPQHVLWAMGGLKLPTGYRAYDAQGFPVADDDQPGSGSWDPFFGATYAWFGGGLLSLFASVTGRITTHGWHGYRRGSTVSGTAALQIQPRPWGAVQIGVDGLWQATDALPNGATMPDTGGTTGFATLSLLAMPVRDLLVRLTASAPVFTALNGHQSTGPQVALQVAYDVN